MASTYGPREFDCTGDPRHWPCGTGLEAVVGAPCPAAGCDGVAAPTKSNSDPVLAPFCLRCRHRGAVALDRGAVDEAGLVEWLRAGLRRNATRTKKAQSCIARPPGAPVIYENATTAAVRLHAQESRLREAARARGMLVGEQCLNPSTGRNATMLPSAQWDAAWAGYLADRRVSGPRRRAA